MNSGLSRTLSATNAAPVYRFAATQVVPAGQVATHSIDVDARHRVVMRATYESALALAVRITPPLAEGVELLRQATVRSVVISLLWILMSAGVAVVAADVTSTKRVLLLHQSAVGEPARARFDAAFVEAVRSSEFIPFDLDEETLEIAPFPSAAQARLVKDYLKQKYADRKIDVIVAQGMTPLNFARENRELFGNPPIVAVASPAGYIGGSNDEVTGLQGGFWINATIDLALALRPDTHTVFVIDGSRENSGDLQAEVERQLRPRRDQIQLEYLRDLPLSDLVSRMAAVPDDSVVLFARQTMRDRSRDVDQFEALAQIVAASRAPVFSQVEEFMGRGIVGGHVWRFENDARRMAEMAKLIVNGASARDIPPGRTTYSSLVDWQQLQRWQIPESRLPAGTVVLFRPQSFFQLYRRYVFGGLLVFTIQLALIAGLLVQRGGRRRAEEDSRNTEERYLSVVSSQSELICRFLPDTTLTFVNDAYCRLWQETSEQLLGTKFIDRLPLSDRFAVLQRIGSQVGATDTLEYSVILPDGTIGWQQWSHLVIADGRGGRLEFQGVGRDITDRKRAEQAVGRLETRNSAMLRAMPDLMFVLRRDGTYLDYHARDKKLLFVPPSEFIGRTVRDVMPAGLADVFMRAIEQAYQVRDPVIVEYELELDGPRQFEARLIVAENDRVLSIVRDVSESKRALALNRELASRLIASQELERQRIARELHDDLSQKIALLNIDIDQLRWPASPEDYRSRVQRLSQRAGEIASDVHHLSHQLHPSKLQTLGLAAAVQGLCGDIGEQGRLRVSFAHDRLPPALDPRVSLCLYRIAQEALHNVAKHSQAREAQVRLSLEEDDVVLQVTDSGVGFDSNSVQNDGLGLVSMRERVSPLHGHVHVHSAAGCGTSVHVRVPLNPPGSDVSSPALKSA